MKAFKRVLAFPGQGVQKPGMAAALKNTAAWHLFSQASDILGYDLKELCQKGPAEKLAETSFAQPAIFTTCYALWSQFGSRIKDACFVGHSLGEITALAAAGAFSFADGVRLTAKRGELMENAAANGGGMAAVIGLDSEKVARLCRVVAEHDWVQVANENSPDQVVVSGRAAGLEKIARLAKEQGARAVIPLNVAGPFHSKLMNEAALQFEEFLEEIEFKRTDAPVLSGDGVSFLGDDPDKIRLRLAAQITAPVRFKDCVETLWAANVREFIEVGPQPLLINLGRRTQPALKFLLVTEEGI